jgi:hypothetical protein
MVGGPWPMQKRRGEKTVTPRSHITPCCQQWIYRFKCLPVGGGGQGIFKFFILSLGSLTWRRVRNTGTAVPAVLHRPWALTLVRIKPNYCRSQGHKKHVSAQSPLEKVRDLWGYMKGEEVTVTSRSHITSTASSTPQTTNQKTPVPREPRG